MDIIAEAAAALKSLEDEGVPVIQGWYDESLHKLHVTLWNLGEYEGGHSDDGAEIEAGSVQVNIWSYEDNVKLKKRIKRMMKAAGFLYMGSNDERETDTQLFNNAMRFLWAQEVESEEEDNG